MYFYIQELLANQRLTVPKLLSNEVSEVGWKLLGPPGASRWSPHSAAGSCPVVALLASPLDLLPPAALPVARHVALVVLLTMLQLKLKRSEIYYSY